MSHQNNYYHKNKKVYEDCVCGHKVSITGKSKHLKSAYHLNFLEGKFNPPIVEEVKEDYTDQKKEDVKCCHICGCDTNEDMVKHQKTARCIKIRDLLQNLQDNHIDENLPDTPIQALYKRISSIN